MILAAAVLVLLVGGGAGYYGSRRYQGNVTGILGVVLIILLAVGLVGGAQFYRY
ncbi:MAG TPA: DUF3309 domain-containing protein [Acetobacteraceae bacterium]|nr:DUF3309 domain-containing protein [Acetobacteraceae bacterium]